MLVAKIFLWVVFVVCAIRTVTMPALRHDPEAGHRSAGYALAALAGLAGAGIAERRRD